MFVWWRNAVLPKGVTWLLECMESWRWVTWLVRWSSATSFSHDQHTHLHNYCSPQRGRVTWESMMCLFTFSAGWVNFRSWGFLRDDQLFDLFGDWPASCYRMMCSFRGCFWKVLFMLWSIRSKINKPVFIQVSSHPQCCYVQLVSHGYIY